MPASAVPGCKYGSLPLSTLNCVIDGVSDCINLQCYLNKLASWASTWQLQISVPKCACLHLGTRRINYTYSIASFDLPNVDSIVDLGVGVNTDLKFSQHIKNIVAKAHQRSSLILLCFKCRDPTTLCRAFITYVRPLLEYCSQVWSPCYLTYICKLERVQRRFTRRLSGMNKFSYLERLNQLGLESLELRRLKFDLIMVYKILHGLVCVDKSIFEYCTSVNLRGHNCRLARPVTSINCRFHSFASRVVNPWNSLPQSAIDALNIFAFKTCLNKLNFSQFTHVR